MFHLDRRKTVRKHTVAAALAVTSFAVAGGGVGYWIGRYGGPPQPPTSPAATPVALEGTRFEIGETPDIQAVTARLGDMQAELMRLNALGERLVNMSGLDPEELDFSIPPPRGGADDGSPVRDYTIKEIASELGSMVSLLKDRKRKLDVLEEAIMERDLTAGTVPSGWPVRTGYITSTYGMRVHPIKGRRIFHQGVDFAAPHGTPIVAVADGLVTFSGRKGGYGRIVEIRHVNGLVTRYAHNAQNLVQEGQSVRKGQKIGTVGSTGTATGPHVHFEVLKNGEHLNPLSYAGRSPQQAGLTAELEPAG